MELHTMTKMSQITHCQPTNMKHGTEDGRTGMMELTFKKIQIQIIVTDYISRLSKKMNG